MLALAESLAQTMFKFTNIVMYYAPIGVWRGNGLHSGGTWESACLPLPLGKAGADGVRSAARVFFFLVFAAGGPAGENSACSFPENLLPKPATIAFRHQHFRKRPCRAPMEAMEEFWRAAANRGVRDSRGLQLQPGWFNTVSRAGFHLHRAKRAGMHMSWPEQLLMVFTLMLTSKGIAGVPRAVPRGPAGHGVGRFIFPPKPIFIILGVDALIDMAAHVGQRHWQLPRQRRHRPPGKANCNLH